MTQSHRMGWPAALNCLPLETRKVHVTPPRTSCSTGDAFASEDWTHVGMHTVQQSINGAQHGRTCTRSAHAEPAAEKSRPANPGGGCDVAAAARAPAGCELTMQLEQVSSPAAPPSTTDKPQGVWVKTSDRKPPKQGNYTSRWLEESTDHTRTWNGFNWLSKDSGTPLTGMNHNLEWLDTTPSKQEDDGWVGWIVKDQA